MQSFLYECYQLRLLACSFLQEILVKGLGYMCKSFDVPPVVNKQAQKGWDVSVGLGLGTFCNCPHIILTQFNPILGHLMSQVVDLILEEFTPEGFEPEVVLTELVEDYMQLMQVFCDTSFFFIKL